MNFCTVKLYYIRNRNDNRHDKHNIHSLRSVSSIYEEICQNLILIHYFYN